MEVLTDLYAFWSALVSLFIMNTLVSRSRVMDADYAKETNEFARTKGSCK